MNPFSFVRWVVGQPNGPKRKGSSEVIRRRRTDNPMEKREKAHQTPQREEGQTTKWTKEKGFIRDHKEKKGRHLWPLMNPFSFVRWVVGLSSLYDI
jgi:hypothetical protein